MTREEITQREKVDNSSSAGLDIVVLRKDCHPCSLIEEGW